jgi:ribose/xylose/arabinose/galactoside ABC-type transport system permease subunit
LSGGYGSILGTVLGMLIFAIIQTAISFDGTLSSWWSKIATGVLLLAFILLQRALQVRASDAR